MKVKIFTAQEKEDLQSSLNEFLKHLGSSNGVDIKFSVNCASTKSDPDTWMIPNFSAMVIYTE